MDSWIATHDWDKTEKDKDITAQYGSELTDQNAGPVQPMPTHADTGSRGKTATPAAARTRAPQALPRATPLAEASGSADRMDIHIYS